MVIVRRLLGLSADAGSEDIRAFFHGLHIPEGGVNIIGGKRGEAFIIFTTEKDGQLAMERSGELLKGSSVTLEVSSVADFKHKIELRLKKQRSSGEENKKSDAERRKEKMEKEEEEKKKAEYKRRKLELEKKALDPRPAPTPEPQPKPESEPEQSQSPTDLGTALILGLVAAIQGLQSNHNNNIIINNTSSISSSNNNQESQAPSLPVSSHPLHALPEPIHSKNHTDHHTYHKHNKNYNHNYKLQESVPQPVRRAHIEEEEKATTTAAAHERGKAKTNCNEPGYLRLYGLPNNVTLQDVRTFLQGLSVLDFIPNVFLGRDQCCLIKLATLEQAKEGLKYSHMSYMDSYVEVRTAYERMWTYAIELEDDEHGPCSTTSSELDHRLSPDRHSSWTPPLKRRSEDRSLSGSPKRQRFDSPPPGQVHCVMVRNLSSKTTKTEIKELFGCVHIPNNKIIHLQNCWGHRTSTAFIMFTHPEDYAAAMNMDGTRNGSTVLDVSSITKEKMRDIMYKERHKKAPRPAYYREHDWSERTCVYARNFPADVQRREVRDFFCLYQTDEKDITLLKDEKGNSIGEAVIKFTSEEAAREACSLHGNIFLGQKIILTCVSPQQMKTILQETH